MLNETGVYLGDKHVGLPCNQFCYNYRWAEKRGHSVELQNTSRQKLF